LALQLVVPIGLVALWWWTSADSTSIYFPPLSRVVESLQDDWLFEQVGSDLLPSLGRFTAGYVITVAVGIALGTLIGLAPRLRRASRPVVEFLRSIPPPLMLPFALVVLGIGNDSKIAVIVLGSVWPVLLNTIDGIRGVDPQMLDMARSFGIGRRARVTRVMLPGASPQIAVGMRTALSVALILMIISEMQASTNGLGFQVLNAQRSFDTAGTYAGVIVIGVVGLIVNLGFIVVESRILRWHRGARGLLADERRRRPRRPAAVSGEAGEAGATSATPPVDAPRDALPGASHVASQVADFDVPLDVPIGAKETLE
jgi:ABC-type nitrate/sulfonate/bicarbonate transport system permease component